MAHERAGRSGFLTRDAVDAIEILPPIPWDKGSAVLYILRSLHGPDWPVRARAFYAGDDETDEDAFSALSGLGLTVRIGSASGRTSAARRLPDPAALKDLLLWFAERPQA
jgi:trehalose-phosphatase